jgi:hypothetical protein
MLKGGSSARDGRGGAEVERLEMLKLDERGWYES